MHSLWRNKRATWRGKTRREETVPDLAARLADFRSALKADAAFLGCGATWQVCSPSLVNLVELQASVERINSWHRWCCRGALQAMARSLT